MPGKCGKSHALWFQRRVRSWIVCVTMVKGFGRGEFPCFKTLFWIENSAYMSIDRSVYLLLVIQHSSLSLSFTCLFCLFLCVIFRSGSEAIYQEPLIYLRIRFILSISFLTRSIIHQSSHLFFSISIYLSIHPPFSIDLPICILFLVTNPPLLPIYSSIRPPTLLPIHPPSYQPLIHPPIYPSTHTSAVPSFNFHINYPSTFLSTVHPAIYLPSVHPSTSIYILLSPLIVCHARSL